MTPKIEAQNLHESPVNSSIKLQFIDMHVRSFMYIIILLKIIYMSLGHLSYKFIFVFH